MAERLVLITLAVASVPMGEGDTVKQLLDVAQDSVPVLVQKKYPGFIRAEIVSTASTLREIAESTRVDLPVPLSVIG